jgi:ABC-type iron transport system FetAB permease component
MATDELSNIRSLADRRVASPVVSNAALPARAQRALTFGLALSALRCTVQYVVLPFILPWIGVASAIPPWLTLALGVLALGALARNVRYLWRLRHARRWSYLLLAAVVGASLLLFAVVDLHTLLRP